MYFSQPLFLLLLLFPLALLLYSVYRKRENINTLFSAEVLEAISVYPTRLSGAVEYRLYLLVIFLAIFALAQPVLLTQEKTETKQTIPLVIALDVSSSMGQSDLYPSRLLFALSKIHRAMQTNLNLRVGLLLFAKSAYVAYPLSEDKQALSFIAKSIDYSQKFDKGTNLFAAIEGGQMMLKKYKSKNILLLSDMAGGADMSAELNYLHKHHLHLNFLSTTKELRPFIKNLALNSHGFSHKATYSSEDITTLLENIAQQNSSQLEQTTSKKHTHQLFYFPLVMALVLLLFLATYKMKRVSLNNKLTALILLLLLGSGYKVEASVLDFYHIQNATKYYNEGNFTQALQSYRQLEESSEILYNIANCYVKLGKLHLGIKYYKKSLQLHQDTIAEENLVKIEHILANISEKHKQKEKYQLPKKMSVAHLKTQEQINSHYKVELQKMAPTQEEKIMQEIHGRKPTLFLRKLHTTRISTNVSDD